MTSDVDGRSTCPIGVEQWELFRPSWVRDDDPTRVQYDYRHPSGRLFSTVAPDLATARARRDVWVANGCSGPRDFTRDDLSAPVKGAR